MDALWSQCSQPGDIAYMTRWRILTSIHLTILELPLKPPTSVSNDYHTMFPPSSASRTFFLSLSLSMHPPDMCSILPSMCLSERWPNVILISPLLLPHFSSVWIFICCCWWSKYCLAWCLYEFLHDVLCCSNVAHKVISVLLHLLSEIF